MIDHFSILHILEFLTLLLGVSATTLSFWPQLREIVLAIQMSIWIIRLFNGYLKGHPKYRKQIQVLVSEMAEHYFKTHPRGKDIASHTTIDDNVHNYLVEQKGLNKQATDDFYKFLGIKVDTHEKSRV